MKRKQKIKSDRVVYTYNYLFDISFHNLEKAKEKQQGRFENCLISMMFSAFSMEAYLNHLGKKKINFWNSIDRCCSAKEKLVVLSKTLNYDINWGERPFQTFDDIFSFRNKLAHGRTHDLEAENEQVLDDEEEPQLPLSDWEEMVNLKMANRFHKDVGQMSEMLHTKAGFKRSPFGILDEYTWHTA